MAMRSDIVTALQADTATIANGASISGDIALNSLRLFAIQMPASWTAANLTFQVSPDGGTTWMNLYDYLGNEYTVTAAASRFIILPPADFAAISLLRIRSGTSGSAVNQGGDRILTLIGRTI